MGPRYLQLSDSKESGHSPRLVSPGGGRIIVGHWIPEGVSIWDASSSTILKCEYLAGTSLDSPFGLEV